MRHGYIGGPGTGGFQNQSLAEATRERKGLRGLEWGAGQCEMEEVDATPHRKVGPTERQSGLIKGASGGGNGVYPSESWEREFYMYRRGTFESLGTRLFGNQPCKEARRDEGTWSDEKGCEPMNCHGRGRHVG